MDKEDFSVDTSHAEPRTIEDRYLELVKKTVTRLLLPRHEDVSLHRSGWQRLPAQLLRVLLSRKSLKLVRNVDTEERYYGRDWPKDGETMIGMVRLNNLQACIENVLEEGIPGDLIETGVWRGGATILMRAVLAARGDTGRTVWLADSFQGVPKPDVAKYAADDGLNLWEIPIFAVGLDEVKENFRRYELLDDQVRFLVGWFRDTLPEAPISQLAVLRLDGDLYESTMDALTSLYPKLSVGGYVIIDDFHIAACVKAVSDYRAAHSITEPISDIDGHGVFWKRVN